MSLDHAQKVKKIADEVTQFYRNKRPFHIFHGSTNSTRIQHFNKATTIDASSLNEILEINTKTMIATVEPNVPMDKLVRATLQSGLVPAVVMEFPGITVGGGIAGVAGESSSFRYGVFAQICANIEIITPNGRALTASPHKNSDLYYGIGGSFGTLGVITAVDVRMMPAKRYVNLTYLPVASFRDAIDTIMRETKKKHDYIDGIMFAIDRGVIMVGTLSNEKVNKVRRFSRGIDEWFYLHAAKQAGAIATESIPLVDYLFRYDRGAFWVGRYAFKLLGVPFDRLTRWVLNPVLHTRKLYEALQASGASQQHVVQDVGLPLDSASANGFLNFVDSDLGIYPLWLCPIKSASATSPFQLNTMKTPMCINIGIWGDMIPNHDTFMRINRTLEHRLMQLGGKKWFYAHAYYTEQEFWKIYDRSWYDRLRHKYHAEHLPSVYDKVVVKTKYPIKIRSGVWKAILGFGKLKVK